mmetsp:Transcript_2356/g.7249  ORF Transcript_2356/g.7249 Transcript_2356/m.7249 type:complete len:520 (+) Transcript_2356:166-1725(+)
MRGVAAAAARGSRRGVKRWVERERPVRVGGGSGEDVVGRGGGAAVADEKPAAAPGEGGSAADGARAAGGVLQRAAGVEGRDHLPGPEAALELRRDAREHAERVDGEPAGELQEGGRDGRDSLARGRPRTERRQRARRRRERAVLPPGERDGLGPAALDQPGPAPQDELEPRLPEDDTLLRHHRVEHAPPPRLRVGHAHGRRLLLPQPAPLQHLRRHAPQRPPLRLPHALGRVSSRLLRLRPRLRRPRLRARLQGTPPLGTPRRLRADHARLGHRRRLRLHVHQVPATLPRPGQARQAPERDPQARPQQPPRDGRLRHLPRPPLLRRPRPVRLLQQLVRHQDRLVAGEPQRPRPRQGLRRLRPHLHPPLQRPHLPDRRPPPLHARQQALQAPRLHLPAPHHAPQPRQLRRHRVGHDRQPRQDHPRRLRSPLRRQNPPLRRRRPPQRRAQAHPLCQPGGDLHRPQLRPRRQDGLRLTDQPAPHPHYARPNFSSYLLPLRRPAAAPPVPGSLSSSSRPSRPR